MKKLTILICAFVCASICANADDAPLFLAARATSIERIRAVINDPKASESEKARMTATLLRIVDADTAILATDQKVIEDEKSK